MQYKNHFLTDAIIRIDFTSPIDPIKRELVAEVRNCCIKHFPLVEERNIETQEVVVNNGPAGQSTMINKEQIKEWHFWSKTRGSELCVAPNCLFVNYKTDYVSFEKFIEPFFEVLTQIVSSYPGVKINRIGLRYIDQINLPLDKKPRKDWMTYWKKYINSTLISGLQFADQDAAICRHMNSIEMNYGDYILHFQYGIFNEDYPAPNKKNQFILDTDVYTTGLFDANDVLEYTTKFHEQVKLWFEKAIKDDLRKIMGVVENNGAE